MRVALGVAVCALALSAGLSVAKSAPTPPDELAKSTSTRLQKEINARQEEFRKDSSRLYEAVDRIVTPHFDLTYITQLILARHWKDASEDQRARFQAAFKQMLIRSYANALLEFSNSVKTEWPPVKIPEGARQVTVESRILRDSGPPLPIGFAMRLKDDEWKVYDITVENISLVSNFRSQAASQIRKDGLEALISKLESGEGMIAGKPGNS